MRKILFVALTLLALGWCLPLLADSTETSLFFDTVDVQVVNIEAVVIDKDGQPVMGLGPDDFEISENGELVEISNFFAVDGSAASPNDSVNTMPSGRVSSLSDPGLGMSTGPETQNLNLVVLVDNAHVSPQNRNKIFVNLRNFLKERLRPDDQVLIVSIGDALEVETRFTRDPEVIAGILDRLEGETGPSIRIQTTIRQLLRSIQSANTPGRATGFAGNGGEIDRARLEAIDYAAKIRALSEERLRLAKGTLNAMGGFVNSLAGMKGRKALLYISDGMSMNPADALAQSWQDKYLNWMSQVGFRDAPQEMLSISSSNYSLVKDLDSFLQHAAATKVAIYPISPGTRLAQSVGSAESQGSFSTSGSGGSSKLVGTLEQFALEESLLRMADETGGVAYTRTANIEGLLGQIRQDFSSFYSLGYQPKVAGTERRDLKIKMRNSDWTVRYGKSAREKEPLEHLKDRILSALFYDLEENPLRVSLTPMKQEPTVGGNYQVSIMVRIPFENILLLPEEAHHSGRLTLFVAVRDEENQRISPFRQVEIPLKIPNDDILQVMAQSAGYPLVLNIEPGAKRIAIGIRDRLSQIDTTAHIDLEIGKDSFVSEIHNP